MLTTQKENLALLRRFVPMIACLLAGASMLTGCAGQQVELIALKRENATLRAERDEARRELEQLRGSGTAVAPSPASPPAAAPTVPASTFTDIEGSAAREAILDLAQLGVFEGVTGSFEPTHPIRRAEFVRWLVRANNAMRKEKAIRLAESDTATFPDVPASHPDFEYIQGVDNAGIAIGYDDVTFKPEKALSREELIAIKCGLDQGGVRFKGRDHADVWVVWHWSDTERISRQHLDAIYSEQFNEAKNVSRTFGAIKMFRPQQAVTRGEAAICLWRMGDGDDSITAADALKATPR
jgi:hypothetical protein